MDSGKWALFVRKNFGLGQILSPGNVGVPGPFDEQKKTRELINKKKFLAENCIHVLKFIPTLNYEFKVEFWINNKPITIIDPNSYRRILN